MNIWALATCPWHEEALRKNIAQAWRRTQKLVLDQ
jgi:hypothetical protein